MIILKIFLIQMFSLKTVHVKIREMHYNSIYFILNGFDTQKKKEKKKPYFSRKSINLINTLGKKS